MRPVRRVLLRWWPRTFQRKLRVVAENEAFRGPNHLSKRPTAAPPQGTLPNCQHSPAALQQRMMRVRIPRLVPRYLAGPELRARGRHSEHRAVMAMPEATVDEHDRPMSREYEVRSTWQIARLQAETQSCSMKPLSHKDLGRRVASTDAAHVVAALRGGVDVHQAAEPIGSSKSQD